MKKKPTFYLIAVFVTTLTVVEVISTKRVLGAVLIVTNTNNSGAGSLRQAIIDANATSAIDTIIFNIPGSGVHTINLIDFLPFIDQPIVIDGTSQPGWSAGNPVIEINGANTVDGSPGLRLLDIPSGLVPTFVKGLIINNFPSQGIKIENSSKVIVSGCFIGTDATGTIAKGNFDGIAIQASVAGTSVNNTIGGDTLAERNIITGNTGYGIIISDNINHTCHDNHITGNYVGTDKSGTIGVGPQDGIAISASTNFVGGTGAGQGNVISGSSTDGLFIIGADNLIEGNLIGTAADGVSPLPNHRDGIRLSGNGFLNENDNTIGGTTDAASNVIAFNVGNGVNLVNLTQPSTGNRILRNEIHDNGGLGIDLNDDGVTPNDFGDGDTGINNLQNSPRITSATYDGSLITIVGTLNSTASTSFRIEFFANSTCDGSSSGEGEIFLNSTSVTTNVVGSASFNISFGTSVSYGQSITATATRNVAPLDTSEFSPCEPLALATFVVTNTLDSGAGSLRQAIISANNSPDLNLISFNINAGGVQTIAPASAFPNITSPVVIDGLTQPGATCDSPLIELNGTNAGAGFDGLLISAGNSLVQGLVINRFSGDGISLITNGSNTIKCNRIGTNVAGNADLGNGANGVLVSSSSFNTLQDNTISGNSLSGIRFVTASDNTVQGNIIGLSSDGLTKIPNSGGIAFFTSCNFNVIGGTTAAKRNIISGNNGVGVSLRDAGVSLNTIQGNYIGVNPSGSGAGFGNTTDGLQISLSSANNFIGGTSPGAGNVIAFNSNRGINLVSTAGTGNQIRANSIHSNGTPTNFLGIDINTDGVTANDTDDPDTGANNLQNFPVITDAASYAAGTVISGILNSTANTSFAIDLFSNPTCDGLGNGEGETYLGSISVTTNAGGDASFTTTVNTSVPVGQAVTATATRTVAPFDTSEFSACRTVTAFAPTPLIVTNTNNSGAGSLRLALTTANANPDVTVITFNITGAGVKTITPTTPLPPLAETTIIDGLTQPGATCTSPLIELNGTSAGVGADGIMISGGGNSVIQGLIINRFDGDGIEVLNSDNNVISCNRIGTDSSGTAALANNGYGVFIHNANSNTIGGTSSDGNLISGNGISGVQLQNGDSNKVQGNTIGLNAAGSGAIANVLNGVHVLNSSKSLIGGASGARNIISGNTATGVVIEANGGSSCTDNTIQGNFIGTNISGNAAAGVGNSQDGLRVSGGQTTGTLIGGSGAGEGNVISNNAPFGIRSLGLPNFVTIKGNFIGTNSSGTADAGNVDTGIGFSGTNLFVGGTTAAERNIISGNTRGISIGGTLTTGTIQGNYIGLGANGSTIIANIDGIVVINVVSVLIGGTTPNAGNVISGNNQGISISSNNVTVQGNLIGTDVTGTLDKGNSTGVFIDGSNNSIGGTTASARNIISGNGTGILLQDIGTVNPITNNAIKNNFIGTDAGGTVALGNSSRGIFLVSGDDNSIGGSASEGNLIAFNNGAGVIVGAGTGNRITANSIFSNGFAAVGVLGIDLGNNGVTANDNLDGDTGANNLQNFPIITSSTNFGGTSINIQGTLNSTANASFQIHFYSNVSCDPSGNGEGQTFIGSTNVGTNGSGNASFNVTLSVAVPIGNTITATATDSANNTSEFSGCNLPTAVEFISAQAKGYEDGVMLEWQTGMEVDNLGFNLYRLEAGERQLINQTMIAGSALIAGQSVAIRSGFTYQWWDAKPEAKTAQYWIEAVDLSGKSDWYGPFFVQTGEGNFKSSAVQNASLLSQLKKTESSSHQLELSAKPTPVNLSNKLNLSSSIQPSAETGVKLVIKRESFYRITQSELAAAGFDVKTAPRQFQLFVDGREQPINVIGEEDGRFDSTDAVEFFGTGIDSPFTDSHMYRLIAGNQLGQRINKIKSPARINESGSFSYTTERRDKLIYFAALLNGERENFFGSTVTAQPLTQALTVQHLDSSSSEQPIVEVTLQGVTQSIHNVVVQLNGSTIGAMTFNGLANVTNRFSLATSQLSEGVNNLMLRTSGAPADISLVDSIRLTYSHRYIADNDSLRCSETGGKQLTISGFSSKAVRVFDVSNLNTIEEIFGVIEEQKNGYAVSLQVPGQGQRNLVAVTDEVARKVDKISPNIPSSLHDKENAGQLVIVTPPSLMAQANQLKALRQAQGLLTIAVNIDDIYDEFNYGNKSPYAIKAFFQLARKEWRIPVQYVLLFGDASYDEKDYEGSGDADLVPTKLIDTDFMETASDDWLTDFNNDGVPDIAIGRLPVRTTTEAEVMLRKILQYESARGAESILGVADQNEGYNFEAAIDQIQALVPQNYRTESIKRGQLGDVLAKTELLEALNRGQKVVSYSGHGSATTWRGNLLTSADIGQLKNEQNLPLFVMMTCLNGYFHDSQIESLSEALMKQPERGAIAVWASTSLTYPASQVELTKEFFKQIFGNRDSRLGDAVIRAKANVSDRDVRRTWTLFGDPTMRLR